MGYRKLIIYLIFTAVIFVSGCATSEFTNAANPGKNVAIEKQSQREKNSQIERLKELLDDQQRQLRELNDQLNECRSKK